MGVGVLEAVAEEGVVGSSSCSRRHLQQLREKSRGQARLLLSARRTVRLQTDLTTKVQKERDSNLRTVYEQLMLLESNLRRGKEELATLLRSKDLTIRNQQRLILALASAYSQITGQTEILKMLANTSIEDSEVDLTKILKEILAHVSPQESSYANTNRSDSKQVLTCENCVKINNNSVRDSCNGDINSTNEKNNESNIEFNNNETKEINFENTSLENNTENSSTDKNRKEGEHFNNDNTDSNKNIKSNEVTTNERNERTTENDVRTNEICKTRYENTVNETHTNTLLEETSPVTCDKKQDTESVTDADSAIMLEDTCSDSLIMLPFMRDGVKVIRSVSDALECSSRPLQLPSNDLFDSASITPVNSPPITPRYNPVDERRSCFSRTGTAGSLSSTPSCSSSEESDASPACTLTKVSSSSIQTLLDVGLENKVGEEESIKILRKSSFCKSVSENSDLVLENINEDLLNEFQSISSRNIDATNLLDNVESSCKDTLLNFEASGELDTSSSMQSLLLTDNDSDCTLSDGESDTETDDVHLDFDGDIEHSFQNRVNSSMTPDRRLLLGSFEKLNDVDMIRSYSAYRKKPDELIQVTYNRVMSNHRSVTKVKDVKYKRINKAKSRSLEELRGKLRKHEAKPLISASIGHSYA